MSSDIPGLPTYAAYKLIEEAYLSRIASTSRQEKTLIPRTLYDRVWEILEGSRRSHGLSDKDYTLRHWAHAHFHLGCPPVCEDYPSSTKVVLLSKGLVVAIREQLYEILCFAHRRAQHGALDDTHSVIAEYYSRIPKALVQEFVKACPTCRTSQRRTTGVPIDFSHRSSLRCAKQALVPPPKIRQRPIARRPPQCVKENHSLEEDGFEILDGPPTPVPDCSSLSTSIIDDDSSSSFSDFDMESDVNNYPLQLATPDPFSMSFAPTSLAFSAARWPCDHERVTTPCRPFFTHNPVVLPAALEVLLRSP
ncbi:hypothetical protein FB45DRAFT_931132 [Roridomyces roridus]|uniref:Integrase zinc-binding domain-containing protein n=1 Tax=Roridomyces roridus TaxID=1738132 RepID=A0AAD7BFW9_9AGAR|nr:hypothetical protein FB45DRAFT_931132 [Roridomyces roridus]